MATTSEGIPLADENTVVVPIQGPLNAMANALNTALVDLRADLTEEQGYYIGTNAERVALTGAALRNGITWFATDTNIIWRRKSSQWVADVPYKIAAGVTSVGPTFPTVALPAGFSQPPIIIAQLLSGAAADIGITTMVTNITTTNFQLRHTGSTGERNVMWIAIQMSSGAAAG
ncbi:hypothetical protein ACI7YT_12245 [Microbacterium sp. M]|uniref:hypothetical protein n=1 Tax=Microbacterium sp. M TaxID=3377125 RepID=UPI00386D16E8